MLDTRGHWRPEVHGTDNFKCLKLGCSVAAGDSQLEAYVMELRWEGRRGTTCLCLYAQRHSALCPESFYLTETFTTL